MYNIYYSTKEGICFYIPDFYPDQSSKVDEIIPMLKEGQAYLEKALSKENIQVDTREIRTEYITKSSRYKSMRVWWVKVDKSPPNAFQLGNDWTMYKWIEN